VQKQGKILLKKETLYIEADEKEAGKFESFSFCYFNTERSEKPPDFPIVMPDESEAFLR